MTEGSLFEKSISWFSLRFNDNDLNQSYACRKPVSFLLIEILQFILVVYGSSNRVHQAAPEQQFDFTFWVALLSGLFLMFCEWFIYITGWVPMFRGYTLLMINYFGCIMTIMFDNSEHLDTHIPFA